MRILVTGATGFIGRNLARRLLDQGHQVHTTVRASSDTSVLDGMGLTVLEADLTSLEQTERAFEASSPEAVFHCAAEVTSKEVELLYTANVEVTFNVCAPCLEHDVKRLVHLSSVSVISGNQDVPLTDSLPYKASIPYGWSKIEAEMLVLEARRKGLPAAVIRPCMVYGEDEPHLLSRILGLVRKRRIPLIDVKQMDSLLNLVDINNLVQALGLALDKDEALEGTFIIADREIITVRRFLQILYEALGERPPVIPGWLARPVMMIPPVQKRADRYFKDRVYDISRAEKLLGYSPRVTTEEGLKRVVAHWKRAACPK